jgi:hypothetical protein
MSDIRDLRKKNRWTPEKVKELRSGKTAGEIFSPAVQPSIQPAPPVQSPPSTQPSAANQPVAGQGLIKIKRSATPANLSQPAGNGPLKIKASASYVNGTPRAKYIPIAAKKLATGVVDAGKGAVSALAEGASNTFYDAANFMNLVNEVNPFRNLWGESNTGSTEQRNEIQRQKELSQQQVRGFTGADPNKMSAAGKFLYNTAINIPQMLHPAAFGLSAAGGYAREAEQAGATPGQAMAFGTLGGLTELTLENMLGVIPGFKGLKVAAAGGLKGLAKRTAGEMVEEGLTTPVIDGIRALTYNPDTFKDVSFGDYLKQMGIDSLGGGVLSLMMAGLGMPLKSKSRQQAQALADSGKEVSPQQAEQLYNTVKEESAARKTDFYAGPGYVSKAPTQQLALPPAPLTLKSQPVKTTVNKISILKNPNAGMQPVKQARVITLPNGEKFNQVSITTPKNPAYLPQKSSVTQVGIKSVEVNPKPVVNNTKVFSANRLTQPQINALQKRGLPVQPVKLSEYMANGFKMPIQQAQTQAAATAEQAPTPHQITVAKAEATTQATAPNDLFQQHKEAKRLKNEYERIRENSRLTKEEKNIADLIRKDKLDVSNIPQGFNAAEIVKLADAAKAYDEADTTVKNYNATRKQNLRTIMYDLLKNSDKAKDKKILGGARYSRETQERNAIDVFGEEDGGKINDIVFNPVHENEARGTRYVNKYNDQVRDLGITNKKYDMDHEVTLPGGQELKSLTESQAIQLVGEHKLDANNLPAAMDKNKVQNAVNTFRRIYNDLLNLANDILVKNGYEPVQYRKDYFPHFEDTNDPFLQSMKTLGFRVDNLELPTNIAGITHQFRPGKKWFGFFQKRTADQTTYDALQGYDRYIQGIKDVIFHTYDIQRLRAFENAIRAKYAPDNIKNRIAEIEASGLSQDEQQDAIDALFDIDRSHLGGYVTNIREYTDSLAGKKSPGSRNMEHKMGRNVYNLISNTENLIAKNMIGFNVSSWMTNFIPLAQAGAMVKSKNIIKAMYDTTMSYFNDDGFADKSTFLTNRRGVNPVSQTWAQKITDAGMAPMKYIDDFTSQVITRAKYYDAIQKGVNPNEALKQADAFAAAAIADRSKGALPTAFTNQNILSKLLTQFQVESNNQLSFWLKDLPKEAREQGSKWVAANVFKCLLGSWFFAEAYKYFFGREPNANPVGTALRTFRPKLRLKRCKP